MNKFFVAMLRKTVIRSNENCCEFLLNSKSTDKRRVIFCERAMKCKRGRHEPCRNARTNTHQLLDAALIYPAIARSVARLASIRHRPSAMWDRSARVERAASHLRQHCRHFSVHTPQTLQVSAQVIYALLTLGYSTVSVYHTEA